MTKTPLEFGHAPSERKFWCDLAARLIGKSPTPLYLFSIIPSVGAG
jgi:hypothetical protein